jgi:hypothetical protein
MPKPYPREFRDDVVRVARNCDDDVTPEQIAATLPMPLTAKGPISAPAIVSRFVIRWRHGSCDLSPAR